MPQIPKHIPIQMLFIVCNFKMPHPIHDILFLVHTVHLQLEILYAFPTPPTTSSPSLFRGCTFRSFGRSLPFKYASQIRLNLHTAINFHVSIPFLLPLPLKLHTAINFQVSIPFLLPLPMTLQLALRTLTLQPCTKVSTRN